MNICWVDSEDIESKGAAEMLKGMDGILVPGGFGIRGVEGKIAAVKYARENKIPYFGICLGMQCAVIEAARNLAGIKDANSSEFDQQTPNPGHLSYRAVVRLPDQDRAETGRDLRQGRQHAPGRLSLQAGKGNLCQRGLPEPRRSANGTVTAMNSTTGTGTS